MVVRDDLSVALEQYTTCVRFKHHAALGASKIEQPHLPWVHSRPHDRLRSLMGALWYQTTKINSD